MSVATFGPRSRTDSVFGIEVEDRHGQDVLRRAREDGTAEHGKRENHSFHFHIVKLRLFIRGRQSQWLRVQRQFAKQIRLSCARGFPDKLATRSDWTITTAISFSGTE